MKEDNLAVKLENLKVILGNKVIFKNLNLEFERGKLTVILGPPGAGKTTMLKTIAGFIEPSEGKIIIEGKVVNDLPPSKRNVSMVFQTLALYPNMTVFENIAAPLTVQGLSRREIENKVYGIAKLLGITHTLDRKPETLSGGEYQRVAIARCLIKDSHVYLMDEPFINLDLKIRSNLRDELKRLAETLNKTLIFATPDPTEALALGDTVHVLINGEVLQTGKGIELYKMPTSLDVADYVGGGLFNIFEGEILKKNSEYFFRNEDFTIKIPKELLPDDISLDSKYFLLIMPENVKPRRFTEKSYQYLTKGKAYSIEVLGGDTLIYYELKTGNILKSLVNTIYRPSVGLEEELYFEPSEIIIFNENKIPVVKWSKYT